jgi:hypothetical protein
MVLVDGITLSMNAEMVCFDKDLYAMGIVMQ